MPIIITVAKPNGDLLWRGTPQAGAGINQDGSWRFSGQAQPVEPPYTVTVEEKEDGKD
jgi:hypothetical protein